MSLNKESTKESQPGRSLRGLPFRAALQRGLGERHKSLLYNARHIATTRGRRRKQKFVTILLLWRRRGRGPHFSRQLFCGTAHVLSPTGLGEVARASFHFLFESSWEAWGTSFKKSPTQRAPLSDKSPDEHQHAQCDAVDAEGGEGMAFDEIGQEADGRKGNDERRKELEARL